jgi:hypothetical protein
MPQISSYYAIQVAMLRHERGRLHARQRQRLPPSRQVLQHRLEPLYQTHATSGFVEALQAEVILLQQMEASYGYVTTEAFSFLVAMLPACKIVGSTCWPFCAVTKTPYHLLRDNDALRTSDDQVSLTYLPLATAGIASHECNCMQPGWCCTSLLSSQAAHGEQELEVGRKHVLNAHWLRAFKREGKRVKGLAAGEGHKKVHSGLKAALNKVSRCACAVPSCLCTGRGS